MSFLARQSSSILQVFYTMGVGIQQWRVCIGRFVQPNKCVEHMNVLIVPNGLKTRSQLTLKLVTCLAAILLMCGDIESNPGPKGQHGATRSNRASDRIAGYEHDNTTRNNTPQRTNGVETRQRSISSYAKAVNTPVNTHTTRTTPLVSSGDQASKHNCITYIEQDNNMHDFLKSMKDELLAQNTKVQTDISNMNAKLDNVLTSVQQLRDDYEDLRQENTNLRNQVTNLGSKIDKIENQSRRNNLRFNGIAGESNEQWETTEHKLRDFLRVDLNFCEQADEFDIDRAHRVKSGDANMCTIIARFNRYKDCQQIMDRARNLSQDGAIPRTSVQQDYSERVRRHRKLLGNKMLHERQQGKYASVRYESYMSTIQSTHMMTPVSRLCTLAKDRPLEHVRRLHVISQRAGHRTVAIPVNQPISRATTVTQNHVAYLPLLTDQSVNSRAHRNMTNLVIQPWDREPAEAYQSTTHADRQI